MANLQLIKTTVKEILDLSSKSAILADKKSNLFCDQYFVLHKSSDSIRFLKDLSTEHGIKNDRLLTNVYKMFLFFFLLLINYNHNFNLD